MNISEDCQACQAYVNEGISSTCPDHEEVMELEAYRELEEYREEMTRELHEESYFAQLGDM